MRDMDSERKKLIRKLYEEFSSIQYPGDEWIVSTDTVHLEKEAIRKFFSGRRWQDITLELLRNKYVGDESACLSFMTDEAKRYYIPAYMIISLVDFDETDIVDYLVGLFTPGELLDKNELERLIEGYSQEQRKIIQEFLLFLEKHYKDYLEVFSPSIALKTFWV